MPNVPAERRRVSLQRPGPLLVEGPVEVALDDGTTVSSDRFCVALCTCRRSRIYPWCDTSHRRRAPSQPSPLPPPQTPQPAPGSQPTDTGGSRPTPPPS